MIPPPKTPDSPDKLMDFANMTEPPPGFDDPGAAARAIDSGPDDFLPPGIMDKIDSMVLNDEELGTQLAAIDALLLGKCVIYQSWNKSNKLSCQYNITKIT